MTDSPTDEYRRLVAAGEIALDPAQVAVADQLSALADRHKSWQPPATGILGRFKRSSPTLPRGLYIYGPVGRGKTMLMDLFYDAVDVAPKTRRHFHEFMSDVHELIASARQSIDGDPIPFVAGEIAGEASLLCFDELQVTDIADAMILGRLFTSLFDRGVVVVATSNAHPRELYQDGLNRQLFLPFIQMLEERLEVVQLAAAKDYRLEKLAGSPLYFTPAGEPALAELDRLWRHLTGGHPSRAETLHVKGRKVNVPQASMGIARFSFADLCEQPLGSRDYLRVAHAYHTVMVDSVPVLSPEKRNAAQRFINLVDTLYDNRVCLVVSADAEPLELCTKGPCAEAFQRTASRLMEMRSEEYLAARGPGGQGQ